MKKLKLIALNLGAKEILNRGQLRQISGGSTPSGDQCCVATPMNTYDEGPCHNVTFPGTPYYCVCPDGFATCTNLIGCSYFSSAYGGYGCFGS
jgi:hypothetical protein